VGAEPTAVHHAPQRGDTLLKSALYRVVMADSNG
jgi:hypothetical protein